MRLMEASRRRIEGEAAAQFSWRAYISHTGSNVQAGRNRTYGQHASEMMTGVALISLVLTRVDRHSSNRAHSGPEVDKNVVMHQSMPSSADLGQYLN
jgi:hypothetical protein